MFVRRSWCGCGMNVIQRIPGMDNTPFLTRIKLTPFGRYKGGLYFHKFHRPDADRHLHDHPFDFWTFPLTSYLEDVVGEDGVIVTKLVRAFRLHRRPAEHIHKIIGHARDRKRPTYSIVWRGRKRREWGFHTESGWVHWKAYRRWVEARSSAAAGERAELAL